ncbi:MAG: flagellin [Candidatus Methylumidiphilus sp.]
MAQYVNTNISSLTAQKNLNASQNALQTSMARLSSGMRINTAQDDAAGFAIATRLTSQINGIGQATLNANDAISLTQTADSGMASISNNLQKMRTLSVQASNSTYTASDRASMNDEVQQLKGEIDRVAGGTNFNGLKLLDGSFTSQSFQVGASNTTNDTIQVNSISSMKTDALGGVGTSAQTTVAGVKPTAALTAGDLTLNGIQVGNSELGAEAGQSTASAFSIATAINLANTGVTATADPNTVTSSAAANAGSVTDAFTAGIADKAFSINGIDVGAVAAGGNAAGNGANLAAAINKVATQSGVTAKANATTGAVTLTAADGRDINIGLNNTASSATTQTTARAEFLAKTGFDTAVVGTQAVANTVTAAAGTFTAATSATATDAFQLKLNDGTTTTTAIDVVVGAGGADGAALDAAWATNASTLATAGYTKSGNFSDGTAKITNTAGKAITVSTSFSDAVGSAGAATGATAGGSFATWTGAGLSTAAGANSTGVGTAAVGAANHGSITLNSTSSDGIVIGGAAVGNAGLTSKIGQNGPTTTSSISAVAAVDISTQSGAQNALSAIDGAISMVNKSQGLIGALQNRFSSAVSNLQATSTNLSAARSRIQDTDFASETASMTRAQVLQQAGMAILGQANQAPNQVMGLLR